MFTCIIHQSISKPRPPLPRDIGGDCINSVQKATNCPLCGEGNNRKCPTPGATEDVPDELVVE